MKLFNSSELRKVAASAGLNEKCVSRLLGSVKIVVTEKSISSEDRQPVLKQTSYDVGLRVASGEMRAKVSKEILQQELATILKEYQKSCPLIVGWVGRGDFNPKKIPERIKKGSILHASRTAGRLRAKSLRELFYGSQ
ncbi:MAG: hypothetical protein D6719_02540 [Candidatus Dadabacteria bacterium]|nr:MAG: hypothetical protein D6719_02540 [Candidatus Dadabacteria bacterium]